MCNEKQFCILLCFSLLHIVWSSCPSRIYARGVSPREKDEIVAKHNHLRYLIQEGKVPNQPRGINLKRMKWDESLAKAAQDIADTCVYQHKTVNDGRFKVGQNIYTYTSTNYMKTNWNSVIQDWFDEYKIYKYGDKFSPKTGHYTQIVWAATYLVGCGFTNYPNQGGGYPYAQFYVCNYGPAGNYPTAPYKTG